MPVHVNRYGRRKFVHQSVATKDAQAGKRARERLAKEMKAAPAMKVANTASQPKPAVTTSHKAALIRNRRSGGGNQWANYWQRTLGRSPGK